MRKRIVYLSIIAAAAFCLLGLGGPVVEKTAEGIHQYQAGQFDRALTSFVEAKSHAEEASDKALRIHFDIGDAIYQQGKYDEARKEYEQALGSQSDEVKAKASYNIGNTCFKEAMQSKKIEDLEKAAEYYTRALELNPDDEDAKFNLEVVRRHINLQKQPQQQQPQPQQQQQQQKDQQQQDQQQQPKPQEGNTSEQQPKPEEGSTAEKQKPDQQQQQQPAGEPKKMTEEEAKRYLDSLKDQEEDMQKQQYQVPGRRPVSEKDW